MNNLSAQPDDEDGMSEVTVVLSMKQHEWIRLATILNGPAPDYRFSSAVADFSAHTRRALWNGAGVTLH